VSHEQNLVTGLSVGQLMHCQANKSDKRHCVYMWMLDLRLSNTAPSRFRQNALTPEGLS